MADVAISIDTGDAKRLARELQRVARQGVPYAVRNTLNDLAFEARKQWKREMEESFILRNKWTVGSIRVERARGTMVQTMESRVGSVADYMKLQEDGGTKTGGIRGVRVPTAVAAGQGVGTRPRTKPVRAPNRMNAVQLANVKTKRGDSKRQRVAAAIRQTVAAGKRFVFLDADGSRQGIYKLVGGGRRTRLQLVWDMSAGSVRVPATPTLGEATQHAVRSLPTIAAKRIREQLVRAGFRAV